MQYVVPVGGRHGAPRKMGGGGQRGDPTAVLLVVIVVLVLLIIFYAARRRWLYRAKPHCKRYGGQSAQTCAGLQQMCGQDGSCLNAVAHCMPLVDRLSTSHVPVPPHGALGGPAYTNFLQELDGPDLRACADAVAHMDPAYAAHLATQLGGGKVCVPPELAALVGDAQDRRAATHVAEALAPLVPFSLAVASHLPPCAPTAMGH